MNQASPAKPKRAFAVKIEAEGDSREGVIRKLRELIDHYAEGAPFMISGGYSASGEMRSQHDGEMTHDRYKTDLLEWMAFQSPAHHPVASIDVTGRAAA